MITLIVTVVLGLILLAGSIVITEQQEVKIIERLGRFKRSTDAGLSFKLPLVERVAGTVDLRIRQLDVEVETKTKDNVFVKTMVSVQFRVIPASAPDAFYKLANVGKQISAYVFDVVRSQVPKLPLDDVFEHKDDVAIAVKTELDESMSAFGYEIVKALVTEIDPDGRVKDSMNEINASLRLKQAAENKAAANKITIIAAAEAEAKSKELQGQGIAAQRKAIVAGLEEAVAAFSEKTGIGPSEVMAIVMMTNYFDTLKELGATGTYNTILLPHGPGGLSDLQGQIREAIMSGNIATDHLGRQKTNTAKNGE